MDKPIFEFRKYREFGDIIGDSFRFLKLNIKPFSIGFLVYVVPPFLLGAGVMAWLGQGMLQELRELDETGMLASSIGSLFFIVSILLSSFMLYGLVFALVEAYQADPEEEITVAVLWEYLPSALGKVFLYTVFVFAAVILAAVLLWGIPGAISPAFMVIMMLISMPLFVYLAIRFIFTPYIFFHEEVGLIDAFKRSGVIIKDHWWWTLLVIVVVSIIASMLAYIFVIPATIYMSASAVLSVSSSDAFAGPSTTAMIIYGLSMIGSTYVRSYSMVGLILQYYSLREKKEGTRLQEKIDSIGNSNPMEFDNEGEF